MSLNYKSYGDGEPIIILHGLFGMLDNWQTFAKKLMDDYQIFLVDQRNHGRSPHYEEINYPLMASDLKCFMEEQNLEKAIIMGHSMGGKTAIQFVVDYPEMVKKLIVVDMGIKQYPVGHEVIFDALLSLDLKKVERRSNAEQHLEKTIKEQGVRLFLMKNLTRDKDTDGYVWKMNLEVIHRDYHMILDAIDIEDEVDVEVLYISGSKSGYVIESDHEAILSRFPKARFESIDSGHWIHAEKPKELLSVVHNFLEHKSVR